MQTVKAYRLLTNQCDYPFHIGITEAGGLMGGTVKSSIGLGALLMEGIGDTMRVSLSADPKEEVKVGNLILKSLGLRHRGVNIISCPTCARKGIDVISIVNEFEQRLGHIKTPITLSIIGCAVNGIGEATHSDIGVVGAKGGDCSLYIDGEYNRKVKVDELIENIINLCNLI